MYVAIAMLSAIGFVPLIMLIVALVTGDWDFFDNHPERRGSHR